MKLISASGSKTRSPLKQHFKTVILILKTSMKVINKSPFITPKIHQQQKPNEKMPKILGQNKPKRMKEVKQMLTTLHTEMSPANSFRLKLNKTKRATKKTEI